MRHFTFCIVVLFSVLPLHAETLTVSAAISLQESLTQIGDLYEKQAGDHIRFNFDASGKVAAQILQGAPVDLFLSADDPQMDKLGNAGKLVRKSRRVIVQNSLVLIVSVKNQNPPTSFADLIDNSSQKIAIGEPRTVPAGRYAMQVFTSLKIDSAIAPRLVMGESVRQVLTYVEQNQVRAGVVYRTDAQQGGDQVKVIAVADPSMHDKIEYPAAVLTGSAHAAAAQKFLDFLGTDAAIKIFTARGFVPAPPGSTTRPVP